MAEKYRTCEVGDRIGYFHRWEEISDVIPLSPMIGGHQGGQVSRVYGIVEFADGVKEVLPCDIKFRDYTNYGLQACQKKLEELKKEEK